MKTTAIICEFDPLHRGHEYLINEARRHGAECVVCVMSGAFCQRGEPSAITKHTRARSALAAGADVVLELPFPYSCASAEFFAYGAISVIGALGCVDTLAFGCESGDADGLYEAAVRMCSADFAAEYEKLTAMHTSMGTAALFELCYKELYGECDVFSGANNVLALEYMKAAHRRSLPLSYLAITRKGSGHNEINEHEPFASASLIREKLREGTRQLDTYLPECTHEIIKKELDRMSSPPSLKAAERAILAHFRLSADAPDTAELSGGLGNRMADAACRAHSYEELISYTKTKKYTDARLRRAIVFSMCGVKELDLHTPPSYTTLLGASKVGCSLLASCKKTRSIHIVSNPSMLGELGDECARQKTLSQRAESLRSLCSHEVGEHDAALRIPPVIVK